MIVTCKECHQRYHVELARIPREGGRIACQKCEAVMLISPRQLEKARQAQLQKQMIGKVAVKAPATSRPSEPPPRRDPRYRVALNVKFKNAREYVEQYAENLSRGGLFVGGDTELKVRDIVPIQIELPGYGSFEVEAECAHVLSSEEARRFGRSPGAGFAIRSAPDNFREALSSYLIRLGGRRDAMVYVYDDDMAQELAEAGFGVSILPPPGRLADTIHKTEMLVVGAVVPPNQAETYRRELRKAGLPDVIIGLDAGEALDNLLVKLDTTVLALPFLL